MYRLWKRGRLFNYHFLERLTIYRAEQEHRLEKAHDFWIHAVSVGEVLIARALLRELRTLSPHVRVVITTTTPTGHQVALPLQDERTLVLFAPFDFPFIQRRAFMKIRPRKLLLIESEIWPNMIWQASAFNVPIALINARLSDRTAQRYQKFSFFIRPLLDHLEIIFAQDPSDIPRLRAAGFPSDRIVCPGSMKYDVAALTWSAPSTAPKQILNKLKWPEQAPILLVASTHPGEEAMIAELWPTLHKNFPQLKCVIAPRHAERGSSILQLFRNLDLHRAILRSQLSPESTPPSIDILILDTTGELRSWFPFATVVIVGKSFRAHGGQNFIEAAQAGKPIIVGPNMENFLPQTQAFVNQKALIQLENENQLLPTLLELLSSPQKAQDIAQRAQKLFQESCGAAKRTALHLLNQK
ncbi:MAG: 3-deoxy-D-manno-octulosonic acid transferase [Methylacidiphilales bacterium]|nr:3-deoxy-D-manno-octulosonic acid transferase [Candidatus Methylacidiphilales bacterium]MDW8348938.1 glycosyltransferase N-terminal domain-containing protein [Verrucomicrobiae bacterium]